MFRRWGLFLLIGVAAVLGCIRLGFWQLDRLAKRRDFNRDTAARLTRAPIPVESLPTDTASLRFQAVYLNGTLDYDNELVLTARARQGAPGVNVLTPLRRAGNDTAVLVNRGWVYSADGSEADLSQWRDSASVRVRGWTETFAPPSRRPIGLTSNPRAIHLLDLDQVRKRFPFPIAPYIVIWTDPVPSARETELPRRLGNPVLGEGSHMSYAIQWFSFATIGVGGMIAFIRRSRWDA